MGLFHSQLGEVLAFSQLPLSTKATVFVVPSMGVGGSAGYLSNRFCVNQGPSYPYFFSFIYCVLPLAVVIIDSSLAAYI